MRFFVGVDVGQEGNPPAIAVLHRIEKFKEKISLPGTIQWEREPRIIVSKYQVRLLERMQLGLKYQAIVERTKRIFNHPELAYQATLLIDTTGIGRAVHEMMVTAGLNPIGVTLTDGREITESSLGYNVPKKDIVTILQILFQTGRIELPGKLPATRQFIDELQRFAIMINQRAHVIYGPGEEKEHHFDLVIAVALAAWYAEKMYGSERKDESRKPKRDEFDPLRSMLE